MQLYNQSNDKDGSFIMVSKKDNELIITTFDGQDASEYVIVENDKDTSYLKALISALSDFEKDYDTN